MSISRKRNSSLLPCLRTKTPCQNTIKLVLGLPQHIVSHLENPVSSLGAGYHQLRLLTCMRNGYVNYLKLGETEDLYGFVCPAHQSPLENFDQQLRRLKINRDVERAPIARAFCSSCLSRRGILLRIACCTFFEDLDSPLDLGGLNRFHVCSNDA
jgi:hypothetical protein